MAVFVPIDQAVLEASLSQFAKVSSVVTGVLGLLVVMRMTLMVVTLASAEAYAQVLRDALVYLICISLFPPILRLAVDVTGSLAASLEFRSVAREANLVDGYLSSLRAQLGFFGVMVDLGSIGILHLARSIYSVLFGILVAIAPVVILISFQITRSGIQSYVTAILSLLLWPLCWNLMGVLGQELSRGLSATSLGTYCFWFIVSVLQLLSPLFSIFLFQSLAAGEAFRRPLAAALAVKTYGLSRLGGRR